MLRHISRIPVKLECFELEDQPGTHFIFSDIKNRASEQRFVIGLIQPDGIQNSRGIIRERDRGIAKLHRFVLVVRLFDIPDRHIRGLAVFSVIRSDNDQRVVINTQRLKLIKVSSENIKTVLQVLLRGAFRKRVHSRKMLNRKIIPAVLCGLKIQILQKRMIFRDASLCYRHSIISEFVRRLCILFQEHGQRTVSNHPENTVIKQILIHAAGFRCQLMHIVQQSLKCGIIRAVSKAAECIYLIICVMKPLIKSLRGFVRTDVIIPRKNVCIRDRPGSSQHGRNRKKRGIVLHGGIGIIRKIMHKIKAFRLFRIRLFKKALIRCIQNDRDDILIGRNHKLFLTGKAPDNVIPDCRRCGECEDKQRKKLNAAQYAGKNQAAFRNRVCFFFFMREPCKHKRQNQQQQPDHGIANASACHAVPVNCIRADQRQPLIHKHILAVNTQQDACNAAGEPPKPFFPEGT